MRKLLPIMLICACLGACATSGTSNTSVVQHSVAVYALSEKMNQGDAMPALFDQLNKAIDVIVAQKVRDDDWGVAQKVNALKLRQQWVVLVQAQGDRMRYDTGADTTLPDVSKILENDKIWEVVDQLLLIKGKNKTEQLNILTDVLPTLEGVLRQ